MVHVIDTLGLGNSWFPFGMLNAPGTFTMVQVLCDSLETFIRDLLNVLLV